MNANGFYRAEISESESRRQLVVTLPSGRGVMEYQIEMIAGNDIEGLLPFRYMTADGKPRFYYDVNGLVTLADYIRLNEPDIRFLAETLMGISTAIGGLEKYLLDEKCVLLETERVFIDPARHGVRLVYLPAEPPDDGRAGFVAFALELMKNFHPEDMTGKLFCRRIIEEVKKAGFRYEAFSDFLLDMICFSDDSGLYGGGGDYDTDARMERAERPLYARAGFMGRQAEDAGRRGRGGAGKAVSANGNILTRAAGLLRGGGKSEKADKASAVGKPYATDMPYAAREGGKAGRGNAAGRSSFPAASVTGADGRRDSRDTTDMRDTRDTTDTKAEGQDILLPVLCALLVVVAYFGAFSYLRGAYLNAMLPAAVVIELLLMFFFMKNAGVIAGASGARLETAGTAGLAGAAGMAGMAGIAGMSGTAGAAAANGSFARAVSAAKAIHDANMESGASARAAEAAKKNLWEASADTPEAETDDEAEADEVVGADTISEVDEADTPDEEPAVEEPEIELTEADERAVGEPETDASAAGWAEAYEPEADGLETVMPVTVTPVGGTPAVAAVIAPAAPMLDINVCEPATEDLPRDCPETEILSAKRRVAATLLVKDAMREYGVALGGDGFVIGRKRDAADLVLDNPAVGKIHAKLEMDGNGWRIRDMNSRNGTYLNNIRIESGGQRKLNRSDLITVANVDMIFTPHI